MIGQFKVKKVFYGLGYPAVGLAKDYVVDGINSVTILATDKNGKLSHPGLFEISGNDIRSYPLKQYTGVPPQYFVPIDALKKIDNMRLEV